jgi:hypothetical protein
MLRRLAQWLIQQGRQAISAPVQSRSGGRFCSVSPYRSRWMGQIFCFSPDPGRSMKNTPSNRSARANSGGSLLMSLLVPMKKTSLV